MTEYNIDSYWNIHAILILTSQVIHLPSNQKGTQEARYFIVVTIMDFVELIARAYM
jgi:hypothetical protein